MTKLRCDEAERLEVLKSKYTTTGIFNMTLDELGELHALLVRAGDPWRPPLRAETTVPSALKQRERQLLRRIGVRGAGCVAACREAAGRAAGPIIGLDAAAARSMITPEVIEMGERVRVALNEAGPGAGELLQALIADSDLVMVIWPDPEAAHGWSGTGVKGKERLQLIRDGLGGLPVSWTAIPCDGPQVADELRRMVDASPKVH